MKIRILQLLFFITSYSFSQSVNDFKAVIVPLKFEFLKSDNQYRLATISRFELGKAGFQAYYDNQPILDKNIERCELLNFDIVNQKGFLTTKLYIVFKDCYGKIIFQSETGISKEKDYELAYKEALSKAFVSVYALNYKYTGENKVSLVPSLKANAVTEEVVVAVNNVTSDEVISIEETSANLLYAQPIATGFQLVDSTPSVVMNVYRTSVKECYIALKGNNQGVLIAKGSQWFFEYYDNNKLISERIEVKF
jgi:hypothetical protein